ncbi:MAG: family 78 glycoside hydrolase catalytic domain [bacterium]|nr:family 78 glycoside hydrolase catalytic domain [bacterium]
MLSRRVFIKSTGLIAGMPILMNACPLRRTSPLKGYRMTMQTQISHLRCEYLVNPLGIDTDRPRFSWEIDDSRRGVRQTAFRILVASSAGALAGDGGDRWDSGRVNSDETLHIEYDGKPLASGEACYWKVRVWSTALDARARGPETVSAWSEPARFSIGLLRDTDWKAQWITAPEFIPDSPIHIGYMSKATDDPNEPKWVQIDLGESMRFDGIMLHPACGRRGVHPPGGEIPPGDGFPLRFLIEASDREDMHGSRVIVDRSTEDVSNPGKESYTVRFAETSGRHIRLTALKHGEFPFAGKSYLLKLAGMEVLAGKKNLAKGCRAIAFDTTEDLTAGYGISLLTAGKTGYDGGSRRRLRPAPLLRGEFECRKPVRRAMAYATALGNYELRINGSRVGDPHLAPGYEQYDRRVAVQAYDVTGLLRTGRNAAGAVLADGWYRSRYRLDGWDQFRDFAQGRFGDAIPRFLLQINIEYEDDARDTVGTDEMWTCSFDGPYRRTSMYDGIAYDARKEADGWSGPGFRAEGWTPAVVAPPPWSPYRWPQTAHPIARVREFKPVTIRQTARGTLVCDFGQGVGGMCRVTLDGPAGMTVKLHHAMALNPDGTLYTGSLWGARGNADAYTLKGRGPQTFEASFTFHGFRFVEISGLGTAGNLIDIAAVMIANDCPVTADLETSDARLNKLWTAILMTYLSCMKGALVDVADRDERWGWMGDCGTTHTQSLAYFFDMAAYYRKRCLDLMDDQSRDGYFPPQSPAMEAGGRSAVWSDAALTMAWSTWLNHADRRLLREIYPAIQRYVRRLKTNYESGLPLWPGHFGDWLSSSMTIRPGAKDWQEKGPAQLTADMLQKLSLIRAARLLGQIAGVLGDGRESAAMEAFAARVRRDPTILRLESPQLVQGAQTAYALALGWGIADPGQASLLFENLLRAIDDYEGNLTTGTISTTTLLNVLSDNGRHPLAYDLALKPAFPSFGYMIEQGATVIWERFDSYIPGMGYNPDPMNGLNHMGFCSVAEWIYQTASGIRPDPAYPAYRRILIAPRFDGPVAGASAVYRSVRGLIASQWRRENGKLSIEVSVPPNTTALVRLPAAEPDKVTENGAPAGESPGVELMEFEQGSAAYKVQSGRYMFQSFV